MKTFKILLIILILYGCKYDTQPIEKYKNKGIIILDINHRAPYDQKIRVKTKDSIFYIYLTKFDSENLKIGDTIK